MKQKTLLFSWLLAMLFSIVGASPAWGDVYEKVTSAPSDWSGEYLIVYETGSTGYVWTGVDANSNFVVASISDSRITKPSSAASVTIASMSGGYSIMVNGGTNNGKYISGTSGSNTTNFGTSAVANTLTYSSGVDIASNTSHFVFNSTSGTTRYRYYKSTTYSGSSYKKPQLYKRLYALTYSATNGTIAGVNASSAAVNSGASVAKGATVTLTATPSSGYTFSSWSVSGTGSTLSSTSTNPTTFTMGTADATVTANFVESGAPITYSVTYDANGATSGEVPIDANSYEADASVTVLSNTGNLAKTGNAFSGWNTQADGLGTDRAAGSTFSISANTTLYAKWTPYTITAASNNNTYGTVVLNEGVITASPASGYTYASPAYTVSSGTATVVQNGNDFTVTPTSDCTVTINFAAIPTYTASFSVNGVIDNNDNCIVAEGSSITFPSNPADISGKKFVGWYTSTYTHVSTAPTFVNTATAKMGANDVTYYAVFAEVTTGTPVTDKLTTSTFGSPSSYTSWSNKTASSSAVYAGESSGGTSYIQIRATSPSGIVSTTSGGNVTKVTVTWDASTADDRTLDIYGKTSAYTNASDLYNDSNKGTLLGSLYHGVTINSVKTTTTELTIDGNYQYIGIRSNKNAMYLDEIDIQWTPTTISNYSTSVVVLYESDLTITSSSPVALEITSANTSPTSTITWTTSSEGAMSFVSDNTSVATVSSAGVITAVSEGTAKITVSQAASASYKASGNLEVTVNVSDNRSACATGIDLPAAQKTLTKEDIGDFAATSTKADGFTGSITYTYETSNSSVVSVATGTYSAEALGTADITITATPTGGNAANYKPASQVVTVTVNGTNSISLDPTSKTVTYSTSTFNIAATVPTDNYNGTVSAVSNNPSVATVSVEGATVTVTPHAVGSAKITVTASADTYYPATASAECNVTFTAPVGSTTAPSSEIVVFNETFDGFVKNSSNATTQGGNDNGQETANDIWSGNAGATSFSTVSSNCDQSGWNVTNGGAGYKCAKFGTGSNGGSATTPEISLEEGIVYTLTFKAGAWNKDGEGTSLSVSATNATIKNEANTATVSSVTTVKGAWTSYTLKVIVTDESDPAKITFSTSSGNSRFFLDEVKLTKTGPAPTATVTLNKYGYATYCSVNPIDFSSTIGYTAWRVSNIAADGTITFTKITEKIKGGQGVLLYNKNADGQNTTDVTINFADGTTEFTTDQNKLVGTTAPTYVSSVVGDNTIFGLSGNNLKKMSGTGGKIGANKAYLPVPTSVVSTLPSSARMNFVFLEGDETTGIQSMENGKSTIENGVWYTLGGQKMNGKPAKRGIYIVNGKKVVIK